MLDIDQLARDVIVILENGRRLIALRALANNERPNRQPCGILEYEGLTHRQVQGIVPEIQHSTIDMHLPVIDDRSRPLGDALIDIITQDNIRFVLDVEPHPAL